MRIRSTVAFWLLAGGASRPEGRLYCQYEVFGKKGAGSVQGGYSLLRSDGSLVREGPPTPIAAGANGRLVRMLGLSLEGQPGGPTSCRSASTVLLGRSRSKPGSRFFCRVATPGSVGRPRGA